MLRFNNGPDRETFYFHATLRSEPQLTSYSVIFKRNSTFEETKILVNVLKGKFIQDWITSDVTLTGNVSDGNFSFILSGVTEKKAGLYELWGQNNTELSCIRLYVLGKPILNRNNLKMAAYVLKSKSVSKQQRVANMTYIALTYWQSDHNLTPLFINENLEYLATVK